MNFTGERVIPGEVDADLFNEHWARYLFARRFAAGKKVLDAACGSGYGTALLAETAQHVVGVDISAEAVTYAQRHFRSQKTLYARADCLALPCPDGHFDLAVAFEIIEHLEKPEAFLKELRRALAPAGLLLISTPNRLYYTDDRGEVNPFHHREFSFAEFDDLLSAAFPHRLILLQNHVDGLLVSDAAQAADISAASPQLLAAEGKDAPGSADRQRAAYFMVALCSAQPLPPAQPLLYLPSTGNVLRERESHIRELEGHLAEAQRERDEARARFGELEAALEERTQWAKKLHAELEESTRWAKQLDERLSEKDRYVAELQSDYDQKVQWAQSLQSDVEQARAALLKLQQEFEERTAWALRLDRELQFVYGSRWYRVGRKIGVSPVSPPSSDTK